MLKTSANSANKVHEPSYSLGLGVGTSANNLLALEKAVPTDFKPSANTSSHVNKGVAQSVGTVGTQKTQLDIQHENAENDVLGWIEDYETAENMGVTKDIEASSAKTDVGGGEWVL